MSCVKIPKNLCIWQHWSLRTKIKDGFDWQLLDFHGLIEVKYMFFLYKHIIYKHTQGSFWEKNKHIVQIDKHIAEAQIEK